MVFSRYIFSILVIVLVIVITSLVFGVYLPKQGYPVTTSLFLGLLLFESVILFLYLMKVRKDLLRLITALKNEDPSLQFRKSSGDPYFSAIHRGFNDIIRNFRLIRMEKEVEHRFFKATIDHVTFGLLAFNASGEVEMVNTAFLKLFKIDKPGNIKSLESIDKDLPEYLQSLQDGQEDLKKLKIQQQFPILVFLCSKFKLKEDSITLVSARDISSEINRSELEAWQKLIRVMKHEILNSISPIKLISSSLVETIQGTKTELPDETLSGADLETLRSGLKTIHSRATGLSKFLEAYSTVYQVPEPNLERIDLEELLTKVSKLFRDQFKHENVTHSVDLPEGNFQVLLDHRLIEHVLINLIKNALEAVREKKVKTITLSGYSEGDDLIISATDNGTGIPGDQLDNIFVPFYSTGKTGNGIGLSFSQNVMQMHNGFIRVNSDLGKGSSFCLVFRKILNNEVNPPPFD